jgi:hypothetical protein
LIPGVVLRIGFSRKIEVDNDLFVLYLSWFGDLFDDNTSKGAFGDLKGEIVDFDARFLDPTCHSQPGI